MRDYKRVGRKAREGCSFLKEKIQRYCSTTKGVELFSLEKRKRKRGADKV